MSPSSGENETCLKSQQSATFVSPMYERLETNIPHTLMAYSDDLSLTNDQLFPGRESVLRYLKHYADDVKHLIRFQTQVTEIRRKQSTKETWEVESRDLLSNRISSKMYDAVVVASGHYTVPNIPNIKGIKQWNDVYSGRISHSKFYRRPEDFAGKKTIIVGNSASGVDISTQISPFCAPPLIMSQRSVSPLLDADTSSDKIIMPEIVEFLAAPSDASERAVRFANDHVEVNVDAVLFCTGYHYSYPFLSSLQPPLITTGDRVHHLYQHVFYIPMPTLAFVGVPSKILPFPTCESQAAVIARIWSGRLWLPSEEEMNKWEETRIAERGSGKKFHEMRILEDLDYHNAMIDWARQAKPIVDGKLPKPWNDGDYWARERFPAIKKAFAKRGEGRKGVQTMEELGFDYAKWKAQAKKDSTHSITSAPNEVQ